MDIISAILEDLHFILLECLPGIYETTSGIMYLTGLWLIFAKCGLPGWKALIPVYRYYEFGSCAGREQEGRTLALVEAMIIVVRCLLYPLRNHQTLSLFLAVTGIILGLIEIIYKFKVCLGLIEVFGRRRLWILPWLFLEGPAAFLWGLWKKFQPLWKVEELQNEAADFFSNSKAAVLDNGLTVNLEERTATEMFKKKYLLRDIHMYVQPGHMVLLLGGSGAGKTTFLNAVNGYERAKAEVVLNGRNMYKNYKEMQYDIGFVPQQDLMRGSDQVFRTLMDAATLRLPASFTKAERQARVEEVMEIFGLTPVKNNLVSKLSGGQR